MSTTANMGPESPVTIKVFYDGNFRRVKMPLRDMVPQTLEQKIRSFLNISADAKTMMERYSDSAAAYIFLDSTNLPVYKQLYRAAKAKSKLKLRVTLLSPPSKSVPRPVSVEDVVDAAAVTVTATATEAATTTSHPVNLQSSSSQTNLPLRPVSMSMQKTYDSALLSQAAELASKDTEMDLAARLQGIMLNESTITTQQPPPPALAASFAVSCNSCAKTVPDAHYHCSSCDDGDYDLCQSCINQGITCYNDNHWLIKRSLVNGVIVKSSTETIAPKGKGPCVKPKFSNEDIPSVLLATSPGFVLPTLNPATSYVRTCNGCLAELPENEFLHCDTCPDFDLCQTCFAKDDHGHHPAHGFAPAVAGVEMPDHITVKLAPGRNKIHLASCDGCDKSISGVRHKCIDCPDWDYCSDCIKNASFVHPNHRFVPIYEPLSDVHASVADQVVHTGTVCDGPLCATAGWPSYIRGVRYKCAVCHDVDLCANCEFNPSNRHDRTHPIIMFSSPVRHVTVTTTGEQQDGKKMEPMGDRYMPRRNPYDIFDANTSNATKTVLDVKPQETLVPGEPTRDIELLKCVDHLKCEAANSESKDELNAVDHTLEELLRRKSIDNPSGTGALEATFISESIVDGTIMAPNHLFEQTWVLRNTGKVSLPAGCALKFIGGDYMGHVDSTHPAGISELVSASQTTVCYNTLPPKGEFSFTVLLRAPSRTGKFISYWRLTTPDGERFGNRLWCEINVRAVKQEPAAGSVTRTKSKSKSKGKGKDKAPATEATEAAAAAEPALSESTMIFPKLEKESPNTSIHESHHPQYVEEEQGDWEASDDGFMTDEEYDILDASDEEYLEQHNRRLLAKK